MQIRIGFEARILQGMNLSAMKVATSRQFPVTLPVSSSRTSGGTTDQEVTGSNPSWGKDFLRLK